MLNPLTTRIETRYGVGIVLIWAVIFTTTVLRATSDFQNFLITLDAETPIMRTAAQTELRQVNRWLAVQHLNAYGDPEGTTYGLDSPLFDEETGKLLDRYLYLVRKFPEKPWRH